MIELENVEKYYGGHKVLKGINLIIQKGEFISIMGSSGSGKSTLEPHRWNGQAGAGGATS